VEYVHHCFFCGWHREGASNTMLEPRCEQCGGVLRAAPEGELDRLREEAQDGGPRTRRRRDVSGPLVLLLVGPWLLPLIGLRLRDMTFGIPLVLLAFGAVAAVSAVRRVPERRAVWVSLAAAAIFGAAASVVAVIGSILTGSAGIATFYLGSAASVALLVGVTVLARRSLRGASLENLLEATLFALVIGAAGVWFVAIPGLRRGDVLLTLVFMIDLAAVLGAGLVALSQARTKHRRIGWGIAAACAAATVGDGVISAAAAGQLPDMPLLTAVMWGLGGYAVALAAEGDRDRPSDRIDGDEENGAAGRRWVLMRVVVPLAAVLCFPAVGIALWLAGHGGLVAEGYFAACFVLALVLAFGRQAYLLVDHHRAIARERRLRDDAVRRNKELEALTGLATTMTQTLEEAPIMEQALGALHVAARVTSAALHVSIEGSYSLAAATGDWSVEHAWAGCPAAANDGASPELRGGRQVARLALRARGHDIGVVTLMRPAADAFTRDELDLLSLLVDEMAVAVQNARDYREKLEQAIRDPLTGLYNRRFFLEALRKEVARSDRYGSECSLVIFDVDDFKSVNDSHGHAAGDDVLRRIAEIGSSLIRPVDSFARLGGEEFALLLPETQQLDALLVAERMRTAISRQTILPDRRVTLSGGIASCPHDAQETEELQKRADAALYWCKRNGKDICAVVSEISLEAPETREETVLAHLYAIVAMIDGQHLHTRDHSQNVATYAVAVAQKLGLDSDRIVRLRRAALLHDIGKVAVANAILNKPDRLTPGEFADMQAHPDVGAMMLEHAGLHEEAGWIRQHHERIDGAGYPRGLRGNDITLEARIIFVADSFEAMTSDRPYRAGMDVELALAELERCSGSQFEPGVVSALAELVRTGRLAVLAMRDEPQALPQSS
jgi:diguanylate cyclase (GGDEF)-like protein/putative nucleotidyltransferase with HDIG domain